MLRISLVLCLVFLFSCSLKEEDQDNITEIVKLSRDISSDPDNINLLLKRVDYNIKNSNLESAIYDLKHCVFLDSLNTDLRFKIAQSYFELSKISRNINHPKEAIFHLKRSVQINAEDYKSLSLLGEISIASDDFVRAISFFNKSLRIEYNQEKTHLLLGYAYKKINDENRAIASFRNAININTKYKEAYIQIAHIYHHRKDKMAVDYYNSALSIDSLDSQVLYNKAMFYQQLLDWNNALEAYSKLHQVDPFHADGHYNLGFIHMELELYDIATNNFSDAIYSNTNFFQAYYSRGICFETLGNVMQAESDYNRSIEINPNYKFAIEALENIRKRNNLN